MFIRVLEVVPDKRLVRVAVNEFGCEHLNASANVLRDANNLSDRAMAFEGLLGLRSLGADAKADYAADFYERWAGRVIARREHDAFEVANPNRVRALLAPYLDNVKCFVRPGMISLRIDGSERRSSRSTG